MRIQKIFLCLISAFLLFIPKIGAQVTITVPSGNTHSTGLTFAEWRKPLGTYFGFERSACIYSHAEIGQYGTIDSIAFYCDTVNLPGKTAVKIYMKEVANSFFGASGSVATEESGAVLVYADTLPASSFVKNTWVTLPLSSSFVHSTSNAVEIIVETNAGGTGNESNFAKGFYHFLTSLYAFQYWSADNAAPTGQGVLSYNRPNIRFFMTAASACSGTPSAGITVSSVDTTCNAVTLWLNGASNATGLSYQWQDSTSTGTWTSINNATSSVLGTMVNTDAWYRCKVSCGSAFAFSSAKQIVKRNYLQCYCTTGLGGGCTTSAIDSVAIETTTLMNGSTGCSANNYVQYPAAPGTCAQLIQSQSYNLHTRFTGSVNASVWLDYDQSGSLDSSEWKLICTSCKVDTDYVTVLSVPASAKNGLTLMRVRTRATGNANGYANSCTNFGSGETEDYFIGINYDVSVHLLKVLDEFVLYPNPASDDVTGVFPMGTSGMVSLFNADGTLMWMAEIAANGVCHFDVNRLPAGIYFVRCASVVKKLVVTH